MNHDKLYADPTQKIDPLVSLWILRVLVRLRCHRRFVRRSDFLNDDIAIALGFEKYIDFEAADFDRSAILADLRAQYERAEAKALKTRPPATLARNVKRLAKMLGLTHEECRVLEFAVLINNEECLEYACDWLAQSTTKTKAIRVLSKILRNPGQSRLS